MRLRFHWMLPKAGEVAIDGRQTPEEANRYRLESTQKTSPAPIPELTGWTQFARRAEEAGIESVLISFSRNEPDPLLVSCALGQVTTRLAYLIAFRSGLMQPTTFVQQINTLSALIGGRVAINIVAGSSSAEQHGYGDFLVHDERYARAEEFLAACHAFWRNGGVAEFAGRHYRIDGGKLLTPFLAPDRIEPEIFVSGHSEASERLACAQGTCWSRVIDTLEALRPSVGRMRAHGLGVCLRLCVICRPTREEALSALEALVADDQRYRSESLLAIKDDSQMHKEAAALSNDAYWLNRSLWAGFVPFHGPVWTTLVGSPSELAAEFLAYKEIGVTDFILSGWPEIDEVDRFGREVLPLIRNAESVEHNVA